MIDGLATPPRRRILADTVYEAVKELVMDKHIEPGARVNIDELARQLKVSPTPIREALARLESDGLVFKEPHRGYLTTPLLSAATFEQLFELRLLLEVHAARRAAVQATAAQLATMEEATEAMRLAMMAVDGATTYKEYRQFASFDAKFHETIALASGNSMLWEMVSRLRAHLHLYRLYFHTGIGTETIPEHERILDAIQARRPDDASLAMTKHIEHSRNRLYGGVQGAPSTEVGSGRRRAKASTRSAER